MKKRPASPIQIVDIRPIKRVKDLAIKSMVVSTQGECMLPVQTECELGPFWVTGPSNHSLVGDKQRLSSTAAQVEASCCSLASWGADGLSLSFVHRGPYSGPLADVEEEDTQDTASSGSEGSMKGQQQCCAPARQPRAAATGEEDSITSSQPRPAASAAFSFGSRPYLSPDLTAVECWDIVNGLLAAL